MAVINLVLTVQILDGSKLQISRSETVEAYDKIEVVINPNITDKAVEIQPGGVGQSSLLPIKSSLYGSEITNKANNGTTDSSAITLDEPQCFFGTGAILPWEIRLRFSSFQILTLPQQHTKGCD